VSGVTTGTVLRLADITPVDGPESALSARICAAINLRDPTPPLVVVAHGDHALLLPAIALSQRTAHRRVSEYVLIDPVLPTVSDSWPDAPVTVVTDDTDGQASLQGRLRGWQLLTHAMYRTREADG
jgi:hypothetical protein